MPQHSKVYTYSETTTIYSQTLKRYGIYQAWNNPLGGYSTARDFADNLKAPIEIPLCAAATILKSALTCAQSIAQLALNFLVFDFSKARNNGVNAVNAVALSLYSLVKGAFDTVFSLIELVTRSAATLVEGVVEVASPAFGH